MKREDLVKAIRLLMADGKRLTPKEIQEKIIGRPAIIQIYAALKAMIDTGEVSVKASGKSKQYWINENQKPKETSDRSVRSVRDTTKYDFDGLQGLAKGRLALAIVKHHVKNRKPANLKELTDAFPDAVVRSFGVVRSRKEAEKMSSKRKRFFTNEKDIIILSDKQEVCVTNQWTSQSISELIRIAETDLNLKIGVVESSK